MSSKVRCVSCLSVLSEMWGPSFNTLTVDHMYSCHNRGKFPQQVPTQLPLRPKNFPKLLLHFRNLYEILSILKKNIIFIISIFPESLIWKNVVTSMPESSCFRTPFGSKRVKRSQTLLKSARHHFYRNFPFMTNNVRCVSFLLVRSEMLGPSFNTVTAYHTYSCHNREKFLQKVPTQISSKPKTFSESFLLCLKSA